MESPAPHQLPPQAWECSQQGKGDKLSWGLELFPGGQKGVGQTNAVGFLGDAVPCRAEHGLLPMGCSMRRELGARTFSLVH